MLAVANRCSRLAGWMLRTLASRDKITMLTLFKSLVLSRLDYMVPNYGVRIRLRILISLLESVQRAFTIAHSRYAHT